MDVCAGTGDTETGGAGMTERDITRDILIAVSKLGARLFRNNQAMAWVGKATRITTSMVVHCGPGDVVIRQARPLHAGLFVGSGDLIGITPVVIRPEHVGTTMGLFTSVEVKTKTGRTTTEQENWKTQILKLGGIASIVRDGIEAVRLITTAQLGQPSA